MDIAIIKNNYLQNIAKSVDSTYKQDNNLDIFEFSKFIDTVEPEKNKNENFTEEEYKELVSYHLNELSSEFENKHKNNATNHFLKCMITCASTGIIGGIIGACKNSIIGRGLNACIGGTIGMVVGLPLYLAYAIIKYNNTPDLQNEVQEREDMMGMIFTEFNILDMSVEERIKILTKKCGYSYKSARKQVYFHM